MREADLKTIPELQQLPFLDLDDPEARSLTAGTSPTVIAEAVDTVRLYELLHRDEYEAVAAVRFREPEPDSVRVYFRLLDRDEPDDTRRTI